MSQKSGGKPAFLTLSRFVLNVILRLNGFQAERKAQDRNLQVRKTGLPPRFGLTKALLLRSVVANASGDAVRWTGSLYPDAPELTIAFGV